MKDEKGGMMEIGKEMFVKQGKEVWDGIVEKLGVSRGKKEGRGDGRTR